MSLCWNQVNLFVATGICINDKLILHIETGSNDHPAEVPEAVLPPHYEEWLIKVGMILP